MVPMAAGKRSYGHMLLNGNNDPSSSELSSKRHQSSFRRHNNNNNSNNNGNNNSAMLITQQQQQQQLQLQLQQDLFRILCPASKIGGVIGKGGSIIKALRQQTGAKIKIDDAVQGSDERVIVIGAFDSEDDDSLSGGAVVDKDDRGLDDYTQGREVACPAQLALFKVHTRILDADKYEDELDDLDDFDDDDYSEKVVTRMLVPENQVGCLLGKRGRIIEQMREETGSQIRILPREQLPSCALPSDEVVQVVGDRLSVKKALNAISTRLLDNPPKDRPSSASFQNSYGSRGSMYSHSDSFLQQHTALVQQTRLGPPNRNDANEPGYQLLRPTAPGLSEFGGGRHMVPIDEELVFRVLCPNDKIGSIIGKGGTIIQTLRDETGAKIKVADPVPGSEERVIIVSAVECPDDDLSPAQEAVFHLQDRMRDGAEEGVITRLLVPSNQVGCLLGKGGNIITEMRKLTRANIRVLAKEQLPLCALENDEVVQVIGEIRIARDALVRITSRLRANLYREKSDSGRSDDYGGYQRSTSPVGYSPGYGLQGSQTSSIQAPRSPRSWLLQNDRGLTTLGNIERSLTSMGSFGGMERSFNLGGASPHRSSLSGNLGNLGTSVVTSARIEVFIPEAAVPAVLGQNGNNLAQICKLSGAKINVVDGYAGAATDRVIEISGTPEQTNAAKSLVEAFVVTGTSRS